MRSMQYAVCSMPIPAKPPPIVTDSHRSTDGSAGLLSHTECRMQYTDTTPSRHPKPTPHISHRSADRSAGLVSHTEHSIPIHHPRRQPKPIAFISHRSANRSAGLVSHTEYRIPTHTPAKSPTQQPKPTPRLTSREFHPFSPAAHPRATPPAPSQSRFGR